MPTPGPNSKVLRQISATGNYDRLETEARRFLAQDPEDRLAHFYLGHALLRLGRAKEAKSSIDFLLSRYPEITAYRKLAIRYYRTRQRWNEVRRHGYEGLQIDPYDTRLHYWIALADACTGYLKECLHRLEWARSQAPEDTDITDLYLEIRALKHGTATESWNRAHELKRALIHDPENATLHNSLGDTYLDGLEDAKTAEGHYREAVRLSPRNKHYQRDLFRAVAKRNPLYYLLSIPSMTGHWLWEAFKGIREQPLLIVFFLLFIKVWGIFLLWFITMTVLLWPACKIYELLLVSELKAGAATGTTKLKLWYRLQRVPRLIRFGVFVALNILLYLLLFHLLGIPVEGGFWWTGGIIFVHFVFVVAALTYRKVRAFWGKRRHERKLRKASTPPPLPETPDAMPSAGES